MLSCAAAPIFSAVSASPSPTPFSMCWPKAAAPPTSSAVRRKRWCWSAEPPPPRWRSACPIRPTGVPDSRQILGDHYGRDEFQPPDRGGEPVRHQPSRVECPRHRRVAQVLDRDRRLQAGRRVALAARSTAAAEDAVL